MSIKFCSLASGSSGNCQYVETENTRIIIDAGFSGKRVEELLSGIGVRPDSLDGIFVTHEHIDHAKGVGIISRRYNLPIYANSDTWMGMENIIGKVKEENIKILDTDKYFELKDMTIYPLGVFHDALDPVGYIIYNKNKKISIVTDTGWVNKNMMDKIKGSDLYLIESNHDVQMLKEGSYPWPLKQRVLSTRGHLSNDDCGRIMGEILTGQGEIVLLGHLSKDNNKPALALETVGNSIKDLGIDIDKDIVPGLSHRDRSTEVFDLSK